MSLRGENKKMEQNDLISFTSVIAGMLLCKRVLTSSEIVNFISELNCEGMEIDDYWNNEELSPIVYMDDRYSFGLKCDLNYDTKIYPDVDVETFLKQHADSRVLKVIFSNESYNKLYLENQELFKKKHLENKVLTDNCLDTRVSLQKTKKRSLIYSILAGIR